ncbi:hypothetical protein [Mycobacterium sp. OTB74]|jgi:hypothetical protein|uniref:hypothetical protein n=1 Tax=Mycobacterium sp. OTB74 TaxID=1853452 RepID=UPI0024764174|nr:hypothetical protein [Mycobacterium sp. OTB74]MDH6247646.1 hypothetical protein [Mycobacterium sp. OTB74]
MNAPSPDSAGPPSQIYIIRHGEKPADPPTPTATPAPPFGVDIDGNQSIHSLLPRGWQRSGALAVLFAPATGPLQAGLRTPTTLLAPDYGKSVKTQEHRTYETIQGLSARLGLSIDSPFAEGDEAALASAVVVDYSGVVLICWEHRHIPDIATALPTVSGTQIPAAWAGDRFDVIWSFTLQPGAASAEYAFSQIPQQLLAGDTDTTI